MIITTVPKPLSQKICGLMWLDVATRIGGDDLRNRMSDTLMFGMFACLWPWIGQSHVHPEVTSWSHMNLPRIHISLAKWIIRQYATGSMYIYIFYTYRYTYMYIYIYMFYNQIGILYSYNSTIHIYIYMYTYACIYTYR